MALEARRALVGSVNLTHRALTANLGAGVLIEDPDLEPVSSSTFST